MNLESGTQEVAKVNPALVLPDKEGKPYTVRYHTVNAMLLNEFLKEHRKVPAKPEPCWTKAVAPLNLLLWQFATGLSDKDLAWPGDLLFRVGDHLLPLR
jgi:hypothetical protein